MTSLYFRFPARLFGRRFLKNPMGSRFLRHSFGPFVSSPRSRGSRFGSSRVSSLLVGAFVASGALFVAPQTPRAWAAPTVGGDENGPKVQIISPANQDVLRGRARILVGVRATQFNPATIQLFLDGQPASKVLPMSSLASSSFDWDTRLNADGPHKLSVRVTDTQGFRGWAETSVYINNSNVRDTVAPELSWNNIQPFQQLSGTAQIQLQAKDNFGVKWIIVSLNPVAKATQQPAQRSWLLSRAPYAFDFDTTKVADGLYALSARAWDAMEQEGQSQVLTVGIVNSPVNATTIEETLDALRARAEADRKVTPVVKKAPPAKTQAPPPKTNFVVPPPKTPTDTYSGGKGGTANPSKGARPTTGSKTPLPTGAPTQNGAAVAPAPFVPPQPPEEFATNTTNAEVVAPALSVPTTPARLEGTAPATASAPATSPTDAVSTASTETRLARVSEPEGEERTLQTSATLSSPEPSSDVLAPARGAELPASETQPKAPVFVARLDAPEAAPRVEVETATETATLSTPEPKTTDALAPALAPATTIAAPAQERVEIARVAIPEGKSRGLEVEPVLSAAKTSLSGAISGAHNVRMAISAVPKLIASLPIPKRSASKTANVVLRAPHAVAPNSGTLAPAQLSPSKTQSDGAVATTNVSPVLPKAPSRIAARPKTDANPVEVTPDAATAIRPSITVSPVQVAFNRALPAFHQVRHMTTLRAIADHYRLPVELVAAANNWTSDMRVLPGMKVQLPRQVQLSYNGQKVRGDVASLMADDTTFTAMRFLFEHTGGTITWDAKKQEVVARKGDSTIRVKIGSKVASVNNKQVMMQLAAFLFEGRTMVPARFFEEGLDAQVEWNPETGHLVVAMAG